MRLILIIYIFFSSQIACAKSGKLSDFQTALFDCFMRHADQRNREGNGEAYLKFKKKAYKILKNENESPANPIEIGLGIESGLDEALIAQKRLLRFIDNKDFIAKDPDIIAHLYCQFDIWMLEFGSDWNTKTHKEEAKESFLHNIKALEEDYFGEKSFEEIGGGKVFDKDKIGFRTDQCLNIIFNKNENEIRDDMIEVIEKLFSKRKEFHPYGVLITGYVDWETEGHYAMILAKKRMVKIRNFLNYIGIKNERIGGEVVEILKKKEDQDEINTKTRVCIFNILKHGKLGNQFLRTIDFNESEKLFNLEKEALKKRKK